MNTFLVLLIVALASVAVVQIIRIFELSTRIKGGAEETSTHSDNNKQGKYLLMFMIVFVGSVIWTMFAWSDYTLPKSASEHGSSVDILMNVNWVVLFLVFFITIPILFYFGYKYRGIKGRKALFYAHNDNLEKFWTAIPAIVLTIVITYGLITWSDVMFIDENDEEAIIVEVYAKQFGWEARYAGEDRTLGEGNVRFVEGINTMGINPEDEFSQDDIPVRELHLPVDRRVIFKFRSQDVIHSAYMPHFRAQMNCVPGMVTSFSFTPTVTTEDMREDPFVIKKVDNINNLRTERGEDEWAFDYVLLCNKICGSAHYNMQMKIIVESEEEYQEWLDEQQTFAQMKETM